MLKYFPVVLFLSAIICPSANADLMLSFSQPSATIGLGQSVDVDLILTQTDPVTGTDITMNGLVIADVQLLLDTPAALVSALSFGPGFEDSQFGSGSDPLTPLLSISSIDFANGVTAAPGSPTSITLGTFTFTGNAVGTTVATTFDSGFTDFAFATDPIPNVDIDALIFGAESFTVNVTAVPEPSGAVLAGIGIVVGLAWRLRKRPLSGLRSHQARLC